MTNKEAGQKIYALVASLEEATADIGINGREMTMVLDEVVQCLKKFIEELEKETCVSE